MTALDDALNTHHLAILGWVTEGVPAPHRSLALIGPGPDFWPQFQTSPEYTDGAPDPMDRWSRRVLSDVASSHNATAYFPFGGAPYHPFYTWALQSGQAWSSPVAFLVHAQLGLFVSYRGALALDADHPAPPPAAKPCDSCDQPCTTACPVGALTPKGYEVALCKAHLDTPEGAPCRAQGCLVRRACPVGQSLRDPAQSAFHMQSFHPARG